MTELAAKMARAKKVKVFLFMVFYGDDSKVLVTRAIV